MTLKEINPWNFSGKYCDIWEHDWLLLTSGDFQTGNYNAMTVGWGSFGVMWGKPFAQVVVRPTRYTFEFMNDYDSFTLTAFPKEFRKALGLLGSKSGRDGDKITESGLTPAASKLVTAPGFVEAELWVECRKTYWQDMDPAHFLNPETNTMYDGTDYHRIYFGEIVQVRGTSQYG
ncbi:MAG: flavin reductase [Anaerolineaceae bacterium]|nr:flavin reductase [Anaerolineaceae bacterium]